VTTRIKPDEQRKQQIRAAATRCFVRRGFAATRLLDIAREAGLSKGGVYFHYRAKEALFHDILEAQFTALQARWDTELDADQPADRALRSLVLTHLQTLEGSPDEARFCNLMIAMASQNPEFRERFEQVLAGNDEEQQDQEGDAECIKGDQERLPPAETGRYCSEDR